MTWLNVDGIAHIHQLGRVNALFHAVNEVGTPFAQLEIETMVWRLSAPKRETDQ
jgi:hypothetical protein